MVAYHPDNDGLQTKVEEVPDVLKLRKALASFLEAASVKQEPDPRTRFHEQFRKEAAEYDRDFLEKYHDDLNTALIFAGLFSAVAATFIVGIQPQLSPDYGQMSFTVLTMILNATSKDPINETVPTWTGPDPSVVQAQSILFASLMSALLASFLTMLGKQWLNLHVEGSFIDRNHHRELRMRGMMTWKVKYILECLPLIMQWALFLFGCGLARYLWSPSRTLSSVIIAFTVFGFVFYLFIVLAATCSNTCPFQTIVSIGLRSLVRSCKEYISKSHQNLTPLRPHNQGEDGVRADSDCITTLFKMTKAPEPIMAIMDYIPEMTWDLRTKSIPLQQVYQALRESLWRSVDGRTLIQPGARDRALGSAKALLHLYFQRRCLCGPDPALRHQVASIDHPTQPLLNTDLNGDFDLESTFYVVDWAFGVGNTIPWSGFKLGRTHHSWLSHILQYPAWESLREPSGELSEDVKDFLIYTLARDALPTHVIADCLFIINMMVGTLPGAQELVIKDRSNQIPTLIDEIFAELKRTFSTKPLANLTSAENALSLVVLLQDERVRFQSYVLFGTLMGLVDDENRLWNHARLAMKGIHSPNKGIPSIKDPKDVLDFLHFHISPQQIPATHEEHIYHAFRSIVVDSNAEKRRGVAAYDKFGSSSLADAMIQLLSRDDFARLRVMSLLALPELDSFLFTSEAAFKDPNDPQAERRAEDFVNAWSTAIGEFLHEEVPPEILAAATQVLLAIANLPSLRVWLGPDQWGLVCKFPTILYADSPSMERCIRNGTILPDIQKSGGNTGLMGWLGMLWLKYYSLSDEVRTQLEAETKKISRGAGPFRPDVYFDLLQSEIEQLGARIDRLDPLDRSVRELQRLDEMRRAKGRLADLREEVEREQERERQLRSSQQGARGRSPKPVVRSIFNGLGL